MDYDKEIELLVNFYAKDGQKEMLEAAVRTLVDRAKAQSPSFGIDYGIDYGMAGGDKSVELIYKGPPEICKGARRHHWERIPNGSGLHIYP